MKLFILDDISVSRSITIGCSSLSLSGDVRGDGSGLFVVAVEFLAVDARPGLALAAGHQPVSDGAGQVDGGHHQEHALPFFMSLF